MLHENTSVVILSDYWTGFEIYTGGLPERYCVNAEQVRGWYAALHAEAEASTAEWFDAQAAMAVEDEVIGDDFSRNGWAY